MGEGHEWGVPYPDHGNVLRAAQAGVENAAKRPHGHGVIGGDDCRRARRQAAQSLRTAYAGL